VGGLGSVLLNGSAIQRWLQDGFEGGTIHCHSAYLQAWAVNGDRFVLSLSTLASCTPSLSCRQGWANGGKQLICAGHCTPQPRCIYYTHRHGNPQQDSSYPANSQRYHVMPDYQTLVSECSFRRGICEESRPRVLSSTQQTLHLGFSKLSSP
jgi:hypothetical protein